VMASSVRTRGESRCVIRRLYSPVDQGCRRKLLAMAASCGPDTVGVATDQSIEEMPDIKTGRFDWQRFRNADVDRTAVARQRQKF
jgi:hypothetical protein